jgi:hypothetical protein
MRNMARSEQFWRTVRVRAQSAGRTFLLISPAFFHNFYRLAHGLLNGVSHAAHWCASIQEFSK